MLYSATVGVPRLTICLTRVRACACCSTLRRFLILVPFFFFFSSRRRHTRCLSDWSSDVCSSDLACLFLDEKHRCRIHSVSPYGCSHFNGRQTDEEANLRSSAGHYQVDLAWKNDQDRKSVV